MRLVQVLQDDHRGLWQPGEEVLHRLVQAQLRHLRVHLWSGQHHMAQQRLHVRHQGPEHPRLAVAQLREHGQPAQHRAPLLVRPAAGVHRLAAQHHRAAHQRQRAQLVQQARLAHAALAADEPRAALARNRMVEHVRQVLALLHAAHEARGLEEALARGGGLGGRGLAGGVAQRGDDGLRVARPAVGVGRHQPLQHALERGREARRREHLAGVREAPEEHLARHGAEAEEVGLFGRGLVLEELRGQVARRARGVRAPALLVAPHREAEVQHLHLPADHQHVPRLQVAVDDAAPVQVRERLERLDQQPHLDHQGRVRAGLHQRARVLQQVHGQVGPALRVEAVVQHADDVRVAQRHQGLELVGQRQRHALGREGGRGAPPGAPRQVRHRLVQPLEGHRSGQAVLRAPHRARAASAQQVEDAVAAPHHLRIHARGRVGVLRRVRAGGSLAGGRVRHEGGPPCP